MEIRLAFTREKAEEVLQARLAAGAVEISQSALFVALVDILDEKNTAIDTQDYEAAAIWREGEMNVLAALGGLGLAQPEEY